MLYYGENQELGPEEIAQKLVLAQRMLEEIRSRQPFLTQRELVDEEADEAQECMYLPFLANTTYVFFLCGTRKKRTASHRATFDQTTNSQYSELCRSYVQPQGLIQEHLTLWSRVLDPGTIFKNL